MRSNESAPRNRRKELDAGTRHLLRSDASRANVNAVVHAVFDSNSGLEEVTPENPWPYSKSKLEEAQARSGLLIDPYKELKELREDTWPFKTDETVTHDPYGVAQEILSGPRKDFLRHVTSIREIKFLLGVGSINNVYDKFFGKKPVKRDQYREQMYRRLSARYSLGRSMEDISQEVSELGDVANHVIDEFLKNELSEHKDRLSPINNVTSQNDPYNLLLMTFDDAKTARTRFEAKRKLYVMHLAGEVRLREREETFQNQQVELDDFLEGKVDSSDAKKGSIEEEFLLVKLDPETNRYIIIEELKSEDQVNFQERSFIDRQTQEKITISDEYKLVPLEMRTFEYRGRNIKVFRDGEAKRITRKVIKLLKKGTDNPRESIDDDVRSMAVLRSYQDIYDYIAKLQEAANNAGGMFTFRPIEDTSNGGERTDITGSAMHGGDTSIGWVKFHGVLALPGKKPISAEFQLYTYENYLRAKYGEVTAHDEYSLRRSFGDKNELGVLDLMFPEKFYGIDMNLAYQEKLRLVRDNLSRYGRGYSEQATAAK